jgi:phospholipase/lecithinase/hemolysin
MLFLCVMRIGVAQPFIPKKLENLTFETTQNLPPLNDRKWFNIKTISTHLRPFNLQALVSSKCQFLRFHRYQEIIAFGDSLTDIGNVAGLTEKGVAPVINGYYKETHFSDNILWIEILANYWDLPVRKPGRGNKTTLSPLPQGNTWAWGGSEAGWGSVQPVGVIEPIPNLVNAINQYLKSNVPQGNTLYAIWSGADNLLVGGKFEPNAAIKAVKAVETAMRSLERAGACNFIIFNMPKLGDTPNAQSGGRIKEMAANIYSVAYNTALDETVRQLQKDPSFNANIYFVNVYQELVLIVNTVKKGEIYTPNFFVPGDPVAISNVKDEGLIFFQTHGTFPKNYLFWDDVHPSTLGHQVLAGLALQAVTSSHHH